jgi:hypothetical protein
MFHSVVLSYITLQAIFLVLLFIVSCASPNLRVSEFKFRYNDQDYIVRSAYCPDNPNSCNHLIGENFVAIDMNQDRIIDKIDRGDVSIGDAQKVYDYSLDLLAKQNKLSEINRRNDKFIIDSRTHKFIKWFTYFRKKGINLKFMNSANNNKFIVTSI